MVFSDYTKRKVVLAGIQSLKYCSVYRWNSGEFFFIFTSTKLGSGLLTKFSPAVQKIIDDTMRNDDETTATQLQTKLAARNIYIYLATIVRNRCGYIGGQHIA